MKKLLTIAFFTLAILVLFAGTPRVYTQQIVTAPGAVDIMTIVTNTSSSTCPAYYATATLVATGDMLETGVDPVTTINISKLTTRARLVLQLGSFNTQWEVGQTVHCSVTYIVPGPHFGEVLSWDMVIPTGTGPITIYDPLQIVPPGPDAVGTWTYNLGISASDGMVYDFVGPDAVTRQMPTTIVQGPGPEPNLLLGDYTVTSPAPAGFHWESTTIEVVPADFIAAKTDYVYNAAKQFVLVPNPDINNYALHVNVNMPVGNGVAVTGPVDGTLPYLAEDLDNDGMNELLGTYTVGAAPVGYQWVGGVTAIEVTADMFVLAPPTKSAVNVLGSKKDNSKAVNNYAATIEFMLEEVVLPPEVIVLPDETIQFPAGIVVGPVTPFANGPDTGFPYQSMGLTGSYPMPVPVTIHRPATWPVYWYLWVKTNGGVWAPLYEGTDSPWVGFADLSGKATVEYIWNDNATLPVELSSFTGTMTAEYFVELNWTTQSETNLVGYRVLRSEGTDAASATSLTPVLINAYNESTTHNYSFTDAEVENFTVYNYWLESVEMDGTSELHGPVIVSVEHEVPPVLPSTTAMRNAYPNPFKVNGNTTIEVAVKEGDAGKVTIYNILGQVVQSYTVNPGNNNITWNGKDTKGNSCGSGIYFYRLSTPSMNKTMKMVIVK